MLPLYHDPHFTYRFADDRRGVHCGAGTSALVSGTPLAARSWESKEEGPRHESEDQGVLGLRLTVLLPGGVSA
jgi:hypothetical protein